MVHLITSAANVRPSKPNFLRCQMKIERHQQRSCVTETISKQEEVRVESRGKRDIPHSNFF